MIWVGCERQRMRTCVLQLVLRGLAGQRICVCLRVYCSWCMGRLQGSACALVCCSWFLQGLHVCMTAHLLQLVYGAFAGQRMQACVMQLLFRVFAGPLSAPQAVALC
jgi:predicted branched-subunit amino acid permease